MYIRIAFSIELRLRVSRSLRSLANNGKLVKLVKSNASQFKIKISYLYSSNTPYYRTLPSSPSNHSHIYKAEVNKVSMGAKIPMFEQVDFYAYI